MEIGVAQIVLSDPILGIELGGHAKMYDSFLPISTLRVYEAEIVMGSCLLWRFVHGVGPQQEWVAIEGIPLNRRQAEGQDNRHGNDAGRSADPCRPRTRFGNRMNKVKE